MSVRPGGERSAADGHSRRTANPIAPSPAAASTSAASISGLNVAVSVRCRLPGYDDRVPPPYLLTMCRPTSPWASEPEVLAEGLRRPAAVRRLGSAGPSRKKYGESTAGRRGVRPSPHGCPPGCGRRTRRGFRRGGLAHPRPAPPAPRRILHHHRDCAAARGAISLNTAHLAETDHALILPLPNYTAPPAPVRSGPGSPGHCPTRSRPPWRDEPVGGARGRPGKPQRLGVGLLVAAARGVDHRSEPGVDAEDDRKAGSSGTWLDRRTFAQPSSVSWSRTRSVCG